MKINPNRLRWSPDSTLNACVQTAQTFDRLIAGGRIHAVQTMSGSLRVCKESLVST
jgi:hypothetical protein